MCMGDISSILFTTGNDNFLVECGSTPLKNLLTTLLRSLSIKDSFNRAGFTTNPKQDRPSLLGFDPVPLTPRPLLLYSWKHQLLTHLQGGKTKKNKCSASYKAMAGQRKNT